MIKKYKNFLYNRDEFDLPPKLHSDLGHLPTPNPKHTKKLYPEIMFYISG